MEGDPYKWIIGKNINEILSNIEKFKDKHLILNILGEHETDKKNINNTAKQYKDLINFIIKNDLNAMISIKPTQLGLCISLMYFYKIFDPIIQMIYEKNLQVCIDMEDPKYYKDTITLTKRYLKLYNSKDFSPWRKKWLIRLAVQCDIKDSYNLIKEILKLGGTVRLCRGAYQKFDSYDIERFTSKEDIEQNLLRCIELAENSGSSLASHSIKNKNYDMECLYGYIGDAKEARDIEGYNSIYLPFGEKWLEYCKRREPEKF